MSDTNHALGAAGAPVEMKVGGKVWKFTPRTKNMEGAYEEWLKALARQEVYKLKHELPRDEYIELLAKIVDRCTTGHYAWWRETAQASLRSPEGCCRQMWLMLLPQHPAITEGEVMALMAEYGDEMLALAREINDAGKSASSTKTGQT